MEFGVGDSHGWRAYILIRIKFAAPNCHAYAIWFGLAGAHCANECSIGDLAMRRYVLRFDEKNGKIVKNGVCGGTIFGNALSTVTPFIGKGGHPDGLIGPWKERVDHFGTARGGVKHFSRNSWVILDGLGKMEDLAG